MAAKEKLFVDTEFYPNYWCVCCLTRDGRWFLFDSRDPRREEMAEVLKSHTLVTFNGTNFDLPMLAMIYYRPECTPMELHLAAGEVVNGGLRPWQFYMAYDIPRNAMSTVDHIDLMEVAPMKAGLKLYAARIHSEKIKELPYDVGQILSDDEIENVVEYCWNDVQLTIDLYSELEEQIKLREEMSVKYETDLRSKSDAQMAEAIIGAEIKRQTGKTPRRPTLDSSTSFRYNPPAFIDFKTDRLRSVLKRVCSADFTLSMAGEVVTPPQISHLTIDIGESTYKMGIGGLHSQESRKTHLSDDSYLVIDKDVTSYYPSIILNNSYYPLHIGPQFLDVYRAIVEKRVEAKRSGDKVTNASLKIVINGSFGKFGSKWSILYSPDLMIQVTLTGQLSILMLIEELELNGFSVVSANTDGFVTKVDRARLSLYEQICTDWESRTGLELEETRYRGLYSRDVSNYIAVSEDGSVKRKGTYRVADMTKNPDGEIVADAIVAYLTDGVEPEKTVDECQDVRKFAYVQKVSGGAMKDGELVGKVIRSYKAKGDYTPLKRTGNGGKVQKSYGSRPLMELPKAIPDDVDRSAYVRLAWQSIRKDFSKEEDKQMGFSF